MAPKFIGHMEKSVVVTAESDVNLTCKAVGSPMPYVRWREGADYLTKDEDAPIGSNLLTLLTVVESKNYTCEASSELGNIEHEVAIIVKSEYTRFLQLLASGGSRLQRRRLDQARAGARN